MNQEVDLIVIGEGIAGLNAAARARELGLNVASFESDFMGGLVVNVGELTGFEVAEGLSGMDCAAILAASNKRAGVKSTSSRVTAVRSHQGEFEVQAEAGVYRARAVLMATGAHLRKLGVPGEAEFEGRGVSHCADCDAPLFADQVVIVAGGGNWALQDALLLAEECAAVHVVVRGDSLPADPAFSARASANSKIQVHFGSAIEEVLGDDSGMTGVRLQDGTGGTSELPAAGLFVLTALDANSEVAPAEAERDQANALVTNANFETNLPGLWAVGQVRSGFGGWLNDAVSEAHAAAAHIKERLQQ